LVVTGAALAEEPLELEEPLEPLDALFVADAPAGVFAAADSAAAVAAAEAAALEACTCSWAFARAAAAVFAAAACVAVVEACDVGLVFVALAGWLVAPSAGSCPVTMRANIATQAATNRESVIAATRRRMPRERCFRAHTRWRASRLPSSGVKGGWFEGGVCMTSRIAPRRESTVGAA
jgi:hypothetical protein